jgi:N-methylhydantoinase A
VCLLHSYVNPAHEQRAADRLRRAGWRVSVSSEVLPEYREFERWSTTAVNAYVAPLIDRYLERLERELSRETVRHAIQRRIHFVALARRRAVRSAVGSHDRRGWRAGGGPQPVRAADFVRHGRHVH